MKVGMKVKYIVNEFDGYSEHISVVKSVAEDHIIIANDISDHIWIDNDVMDMIEEVK